MSTANPNYSFTISQESNSYKLLWKPAMLGIKFALPLIWIVAILTAVLTIVTMENNSSGITTFIPKWIGYFLLFYIGTIVILNVVVRRGGMFSFNKEGFTVGATTYASKEIQGIYVRSPKGEKLEILTYNTHHGFGIAGAVNNAATGLSVASTQARVAMMRAIREKSFSVCIQYGEREVPLAKHLTLFTAKAMLNKIDELV